jgi:two-component system sensor histidine kinase TorS
LRLLHERPIDLALIDMNLPDGDGRELLARLRALPAHAHTPAVLMSAHIPRREVDALLEAGFAAFLSKPFSRQRLRALLAELLAGGCAEPPAGERAPGTVTAPEAPQVQDWIDIDFLRAEQEALGEEIVADIVRVFRTQGQPLIDALLAAAHADEHAECARLAHKLRGAAGNVGAGRLAECAGTLEDALKRDPSRAAGIEELAARAGELGEAWARTLQTLDALRLAAEAPAAAAEPAQPPPGSTSTASR